MFRIILIALASIAALGCARDRAIDPVIDEATRRSVTQGEVIGVTNDVGAHVWRGIPFAEPPVGDLRWRAPRPAKAWDGVLEATQFSDRCLQLSNRLDAPQGIKPGRLVGAEDCLYLNIYASPGEAKKRPVMVWIHGGANVWGRASGYDGSKLALNEDVVIVTTQYRVGPFGFLAHPLLREDAEIKDDTAANFATLDLIATLKWVSANIEAFGGDPENITIFGESAGGHNVASLLASPLAAGLFHKAILQSGSFDSVSLTDAETDHPNSAERIIAKLGIESVDELRQVEPEALFKAYMDGRFPWLDMPTVIQDGVSLPSGPMRDAFAATDTFNAVPIITGTNRDEMKFFTAGRPDLVKRRLFLFPAAKDQTYYDAFNAYLSRIWRIRSIDEPAAMITAAGHQPVYAYRFDWDESGKFGLSDFSKLFGAGHSLEIPFVFNHFEFFGAQYDKYFYPEKSADSRERLSLEMGAYWANFARTGAPTTDPDIWPAWRADKSHLKRFDSDSGVQNPLLPGGDSLNALIADLKADQRLTTAQKCDIGEETAVWLETLGAEINAAVGCS